MGGGQRGLVQYRGKGEGVGGSERVVWGREIPPRGNHIKRNGWIFSSVWMAQNVWLKNNIRSFEKDVRFPVRFFVRIV